MINTGWWKAQFVSRFIVRLGGPEIDPEMLQCAMNSANASLESDSHIHTEDCAKECADEEADALAANV